MGKMTTNKKVYDSEIIFNAKFDNKTFIRLNSVWIKEKKK